MRSPFPGMNPYLEQPRLWRQVHADLIVDMRRYLTPVLRPHYSVEIEQRTYVTLGTTNQPTVSIPDVLVLSPSNSETGSPAYASATVTTPPLIAELPLPAEEEIKQRYLQIRHLDSQEIITVIEILSPTNKLAKSGREQYEQKRLEILGSLTNLVEINLLRTGRPLSMTLPKNNHYRLVVSRYQHRPQAEVYLFSVRDPIPDLPIPLRPSQNEPYIPLNRLLHDLYDQGGYDLSIDYHKPPTPPLSKKDADWAQKQLTISN